MWKFVLFQTAWPDSIDTQNHFWSTVQLSSLFVLIFARTFYKVAKCDQRHAQYEKWACASQHVSKIMIFMRKFTLDWAFNFRCWLKKQIWLTCKQFNMFEIARIPKEHSSLSDIELNSACVFELSSRLYVSTFLSLWKSMRQQHMPGMFLTSAHFTALFCVMPHSLISSFISTKNNATEKATLH